MGLKHPWDGTVDQQLTQRRLLKRLKRTEPTRGGAKMILDWLTQDVARLESPR